MCTTSLNSLGASRGANILNNYQTKRFTNVIPDLIKTAITSTLNYRLGACIMKGKKKVTQGQTNTIGEGERGSRHAELRAMLSFCKNTKFRNGWKISDDVKKKNKNFSILVIRIITIDPKITDQFSLGNARPCHKCLEMMKELGFNEVHYSNDIGEIVSEKINNMISVQASYVAVKIAYIKNSKEHISCDKKVDRFINRQTFYDSVIKKYIPDEVKKVNFMYFVTYNLKYVPVNYKIEEMGQNVSILNNMNQVVKTINII
jgi:deoxycytidylate deaminase